MFVKRVKAGSDLLFDEALKDYGGLTRLVKSSLTRSEEWSVSATARERFGKTIDISEMFESLCIFAPQIVIPKSVLERMWHVEDLRVDAIMKKFEDFHLAKQEPFTDVENEQEYGLRIHDIILCVSQKFAEKRGKFASWHKGLLNSY